MEVEKNIILSSNLKETSSSVIAFKDRIWSVSFHPKLNLFVAVGSDKKIHLVRYFPESHKETQLKIELSIETQHTRTIRSSEWDSSGELLGIGAFDGQSSIYCFPNLNDLKNYDSEIEDTNTHHKIFNYKIVSILKGHESEIKCIAFSCTSEFYATCSRDKTIWVWQVELSDDNNNLDYKSNLTYDCSSILEEHTQDVKNIKFHPIIDDVLFSASYDNSIKIWQNSTAEEDWVCIKTISDSHNNTIWCLSIDSFFPYLLYSCGEDNRINVFNMSSNKKAIDDELDVDYDFKNTHSVGFLDNAHQRSIYSIKGCKRIIISGGGDNTVNIFNVSAKDKSFDKVEIKNIINYDQEDDINTVDIKLVNIEQKSYYYSLSGGDDFKVNFKIYES